MRVTSTWTADTPLPESFKKNINKTTMLNTGHCFIYIYNVHTYIKGQIKS